MTQGRGYQGLNYQGCGRDGGRSTGVSRLRNTNRNECMFDDVILIFEKSILKNLSFVTRNNDPS